MIEQGIGCRPAALHRNARRPVLVVNEVRAARALHQADAELVDDVADDQ